MRLTVDIPDELYDCLKIHVALKKQSMKDFIINALVLKLKDDKNDELYQQMKKIYGMMEEDKI